MLHKEPDEHQQQDQQQVHLGPTEVVPFGAEADERDEGAGFAVLLIHEPLGGLGTLTLALGVAPVE